MVNTTKSNNWKLLQNKLKNENNKNENITKKRKRTEISQAIKAPPTHSPLDPSPASSKKKSQQEVIVPGSELSEREKSKYIGLDCEMVGIGLSGKQSVLARCCLVDFDGNKLYDEFVRPKSFVTDFRTQWSGVRQSDLRKNKAVTFEECIHDVAKLLQGKILVGHALHNDLDVLMLSHPRSKIRDTATYPPYMRTLGKFGGKRRPRALRDLSKQYLHKTIQDGEHDPGIDASTAMMLYRLKRSEWEKSLRDAAKLRIEHNLKSNPKKSASSNTTTNNENNTPTTTSRTENQPETISENNNSESKPIVTRKLSLKSQLRGKKSNTFKVNKNKPSKMFR